MNKRAQSAGLKVSETSSESTVAVAMVTATAKPMTRQSRPVSSVTIEVAAPPEAVWKNVVEFAEPARQLCGQLGFAE